MLCRKRQITCNNIYIDVSNVENYFISYVSETIPVFWEKLLELLK